MLQKRFVFLFLFLFTGFSSLAFAQHLKSMEFHNQNISDILMVLAEATGTSIIPDETVTGVASFYFSESDFEDSLALFLSTYKLHYLRTGNVFKVSRIEISSDPILKTIHMKADDVDIESLLKTLSKTINKTILYDALPKTMISVNIDNLPPEKVLEILIRKIPEYTLEQNDSFFYLRHVPVDQQNQKTELNTGITRNNDLYSLSIDKSRFLDLIVDLFKKAGKEYSLFVKSDTILENMYFSDRDFDGLLRLILEQGNADYIIYNNVYYIIELQQHDIAKKLKQTSMITLNYISAESIPNLLPSELTAGNTMKIDKNTNKVILTGTEEEIGPILKFIKLVDQPNNGLQYKRFEIKYLKVKDLLSIIPSTLTPVPPLIIPDSNSFIISGTQESLAALTTYVATVDNKSEGYPVRLRFMKMEELLKNLPPSITKDDIVDSGYPNLFFFSGSEEKRKLFLRELSTIDHPKPQIRYELLVIQYLKTNSKTFSASINANKKTDSSSTAIVGNLSNVFSLSFDVVSQFGYEFAAKLSSAIGENLAQVYADTTLNGLSGQDIKFQNTDTSRYQALEYDSTTKTTSSTGVTQTITSGLIVTLNGWVSGDNMITMTVNATVSKQNDSASSTSTTTTSDSTTSTLPSTSERVVTTQVRTPSGKPIIISGLIKEDVTKNVQRVPLLGYIPFLGRFFKNETESREKSEVVIYIVPHLIYDANDEDTTNKLERYYTTFIKGTR